MELTRLTTIDLQSEALANGRARAKRVSLKARSAISTRDARAHQQLAGLAAGDCLHVASMGELSLHDVAAAVVAHYGPFECLTLTTWAASEDAIKCLIALRTAGGVRRLEALVDSRMPTDSPDAHALMALAFDLYRPGSNHSKIMAFTGGAAGVSIVSTANLTRNPRCEVLVVTLDSHLADFHAAWIREVLHAA